WGAGISNESGATLALSHSTVSYNVTKGGHRGDNSFGNGFGIGGGLENEFGATVTVTNSTFTANQAVGGAGDAGVSGRNGVGRGRRCRGRWYRRQRRGWRSRQPHQFRFPRQRNGQQLPDHR